MQKISEQRDKKAERVEDQDRSLILEERDNIQFQKKKQRQRKKR